MQMLPSCVGVASRRIVAPTVEGASHSRRIGAADACTRASLRRTAMRWMLRATIRLGAAAVGTSVGVTSARAQPARPAAEVLAAEEARRRAILANDTSALSALISDSLVVTLADGSRRGKQEEVGQNRASDRGIEAWDASDVTVRVHGDAAVVTGYAQLRDTFRGQPRRFGFHFTHVWSHRRGRWILVARHMSGRRDL
jgi:ketosteroid isomerase-like protein